MNGYSKYVSSVAHRDLIDTLGWDYVSLTTLAFLISVKGAREKQRAKSSSKLIMELAAFMASSANRRNLLRAPLINPSSPLHDRKNKY